MQIGCIIRRLARNFISRRVGKFCFIRFSCLPLESESILRGILRAHQNHLIPAAIHTGALQLGVL